MLHCQVRRYSPWKALRMRCHEETWGPKSSKTTDIFGDLHILHGSSTSQHDDDIWWSYDELMIYDDIINDDNHMIYDDLMMILWSWNFCVLYFGVWTLQKKNQVPIRTTGSTWLDDLHMIDEDLWWHIHPWRLTWYWTIPMFNRKCTFKWWMFDCHVSFPGGVVGLVSCIYRSCSHHLPLPGKISKFVPLKTSHFKMKLLGA